MTERFFIECLHAALRTVVSRSQRIRNPLCRGWRGGNGSARLTADIDLILDLEESAAARAMHALAGLGLRPRAPVDPADFADSRIREGWLQDKGMQVFSLFHPDNPVLSVDVFTTHPIEFETLFGRSDVFEICDVSVRVASISDLISLKRLADRPRDRDDIEMLQKIARLKEWSR